MEVHEAQAYKDPGTPEEQSRRTFLANATIAVGGVIGLIVAIPVLGSLIPESLIKPEAAKGTWSPLTPEEFAGLQKSTNSPIKMTITFKATDGYFPPANDSQDVWGIKLTPEQRATFQAKRPDLFANPAGRVDFPVVNMGFVIFSSVCPHLGCHYAWSAENKRFMCPCHGSQFSIVGEHLAGPAPRGLDPLPLREASGTAEVTWIQYQAQQPARVIVAYT
ncbi:MAG: ubiquinol-cytochrome c reductase iron-sulfur subunit [Candidatus Baltobacteraceae bacterium]